MTSHRLVDKAIYLASTVDKAIIVCILDAQVMGAPPKQMTQSDRDLTEFRQPLQVHSHREMSGILVQLGHIQHN